MKVFQKGFNYSQDGPGNRLVYHLQGCNFRCKWCSNPQSMDMCGNSKNIYELSPEEILDEAKRSSLMFFDGGGVTFTGGEPTVQFNELKQTLMLLKSEGINTAIETNGSNPRLSELFPLIDLLIMDIKHFDGEKHKYWTGVGNTEVLENLKKTVKSGKAAHIRIPLVKCVNNEPAEFARLFAKLDTLLLTFEILPYHEYGRSRWETPYEITDGFVSGKDLEEFTRVFSLYGLKIKNT